MSWQHSFILFLVFIHNIQSFGENGSGLWNYNFSTESFVYPLYASAKPQGLIRIHVRPRTTIFSTTVLTTTTTITTTTLPSFDALIEEYLKKKSLNRFEKWDDNRNFGWISSSPSVLAVFALCSSLLYNGIIVHS
ncbi:unnamed protein product [Rotaria magnacalcarata]|uniref:Uncharacterized protein n=1 Tax=Rotaria magnacalcarata TaxID=392030 RepID=A0A816NZT5_9BILA|nr:unnamed protein product [Rotaria magnacalcarata]CAF4088632.1 unnamed protein product [Rotaria magnacalcarata]